MPQARVALLLALSLTIACGATETIPSVPRDAAPDGPQPDAGDAGDATADAANDCVSHGFQCFSTCSGSYTLVGFSCDTASLHCCKTF